MTISLLLVKKDLPAHDTERLGREEKSTACIQSYTSLIQSYSLNVKRVVRFE